MARPRKQITKNAVTDGASELICPECGRTFERAAALGAHRRRAHGVAGATAKRTQNRQRRRKSTEAMTANDGRRSRGRGSAQQASVDRDALLQQLFPGGIPARESVITRLNSWLDEAEKLAAIK